MKLDCIDWNEMWKEESCASHWQDASKKGLWDKRAYKFNKKVGKFITGGNRDKGDYISNVLAKIEIKPGWTVLDIGSGPGSLAIPLAQKGAKVTAMDISLEMLKYLKINAAAAGADNITTVNSSWETAMADKLVVIHDVVVASRSLTPVDIRQTMSDLDSIARYAVYITFPIIHLPFDWEAYKAIGRNGKKNRSPYIYVYNTLYQMGIAANVEIIYSVVRTNYESIEDAIENLQWRTEPFTPEERAKLVKFLEKKFAARPPDQSFIHEGRSVWALISWKKES